MSQVWTVVHLNARRFPKETNVTQVVADSPYSALNIFINMPGMGDQFVACIVAMSKDAVYYTKEDLLGEARPTEG